jgi:Protein of unknown function (DUF1769)
MMKLPRLLLTLSTIGFLVTTTMTAVLASTAVTTPSVKDHKTSTGGTDITLMGTSSTMTDPTSLEWPHGPIMVQAGTDTQVLGLKPGQPLPLGVPFEFESPIFKGKMLLRFRHAPSDDPASHKAYFEGRKRLMQTVVQGQFTKRGIKMSDLWAGCIFDRPLAQAPPPSFTKIMDAVLRRVAPGVIMDLGSKSPRVVALYAGTAQTMSVDAPGREPEITGPHIPENVADDANLVTANKRKKHLSNPKKAAKLEYDTNKVYTFHTYDDSMDYGRGSMRIPMYGDYDIKPAIGPQPLSLTAVTTLGETLYSFRIWHEETWTMEN